MNPALERLQWIFLTAFVVCTVAIFVWQIGWIAPRQECEKSHKWWDNSQRVCAQPILISDITGRVITDPKVRAEALQAIGKAPK